MEIKSIILSDSESVHLYFTLDISSECSSDVNQYFVKVQIEHPFMQPIHQFPVSGFSLS